MFDEAEFILNNLPFEEALKFFQGKVPMTEDQFYKIAKKARTRAFTVADMASLDALKDLQGSLTKAIESGQSLVDWKKSARELLSQWDVGGWRAETIYRTNLQTAYQVGRYEQMTDPDVIDMRPYWMYVAVMDSHTRPEHAALHGKIFRADDPFWDHWYPPNGFNCRCTVHTLSGSELDREGLRVQKGEDWHNRPVKLQSGMVAQLIPDPGWDFNPGKQGLAKAGIA